MKKLISIISIAALLMTVQVNIAGAQDKKTVRQQKKELYKNSPSLIKKEARKLTKEGWKSMDLPLEKMLQTTWEKQIQSDEDGYPKYIYVTTQATSTSYSAAQMQAQNVAKIRIAGLLSSTVASLADIALNNQEISPQQSVAMTSAIEKAKVLVSGKLGRLMTPLNIYKENHDGFTVRNTVMYDMKQAMRLMIDAVNSNVPENDKGKIEAVIGVGAMIDQFEKSNTEE